MVPARSRKEIEFFASDIRNCLGLKNNMYVPVMHVAECIIPMIDDTYSFNAVEQYKLPYEYAKYCPNTNELLVREDVYIEACNHNRRHRFTIAHEIGHYFLHKDVSSFSRCADIETIPAYKDAEWQANVFSAAFLAPPELITGMTINEVSDKCGISFQAAEIALKRSKRGQTSRLSPFT